MKTFFILLVLPMIISVSPCRAQKPTFGVRAGLNITSAYNGFSEYSYTARAKIGFHAGVTAEIETGKRFSLQPGLIFTTKGAKYKGPEATVTLTYLELPVNFLFRSMLPSGNFIFGVGPYVAAALSGTYREADSADVKFKFKHDISMEESVNDSRYKRRLDAGINLLAGYEFTNRFSFQINAQLGLLSTSPTLAGNSFYFNDNNLGCGFSVGYRL